VVGFFKEIAMGLFDNVRCKYPLPDPEAQDLEYQTKSTFAPYLESYIIAQDGRLLKEAYDVREEQAPDCPFGFRLLRENCRWVQADFRGELEIHMSIAQPDGSLRWYSYLFWFKDNRVADLQRGSSWGQVISPHKPVQAP
jgi:hypothetical protein